jgi:ligand-binding SRPBCC domain-containing protein
MKIHRLEREQWIPRPMETVFDFFARAENLARITPAWMRFEIRTRLPIDMCTGARIDYTIRLAGIPLGWRTRITRWEPGRCFEDVQERGPYRLWEHTHRFQANTGGVLISDRVRYGLPLAWAGRAAHALAVRSTLSAIFDHRFDRIRELLIGSASGSDT